VKRWPWAPLGRLLGAMTDSEIAENVGSTRAIVSAAKNRGLSTDRADDWSTKLGLGPHVVWDGWVDHLTADVERRACAECGLVFVATNPRRRFCARRCRARFNSRTPAGRARDRAYKARRRQDPAFRAARAEESARYRSDSALALAIYRRAYYAKNRDRILAAQRERDMRRRAA
jgi:hypothetical protein